LQGAERLERWLVLPNQVELQPVTWEIRGLAPSELPAGAELPTDVSGMAIYQVVDDAVSAVLTPASRPIGEPQVYLSDVSVSWQGDGVLHGVAAFDLDPAGNAVCPLALPDGYRLHHVSVNGIPASVSATGENQWQLGLGSDQLPQRIEVVYQGRLAMDDATYGGSALAPQLGDLAVQNVVWTVQSPSGFQLSTASSLRSTTAVRQEFVRLKSIAAVMNLAPAILPSEAEEEVAAWYAPWARRYTTSLAAVRRELLRTRDSETMRSLEGELRALEQEQSQIARRLGMPQNLLRPATAPSSAEQSRHLWDAVVRGGSPPLRYISNGPVEPLVVEAASGAAGHWFERLFWALVVMATVAGAISLMRSRYGDRLWAWRHIAGVVLGLAWWWLLWPAFLGWLIVAASLLALLRDRRQTHREAESAVVRLSAGSHS
jgi:hypothetical protein